MIKGKNNSTLWKWCYCFLIDALPLSIQSQVVTIFLKFAWFLLSFSMIMMYTRNELWVLQKSVDKTGLLLHVCLFCTFYSFCTEVQGDTRTGHARHIPFSVPTHTQRLTRDSHHTGNFMPCSFRVVCGFSNVPQWSYINMEGICETGPTVYRPYPRRLENLTICWFNYKGSTFYSVILRPWVLVRLESNLQPLAWQSDVPPLSHLYDGTFSGRVWQLLCKYWPQFILSNWNLIQF